MGGAIKIRTLTAPSTDLGSLDPGEYLGGLEFYETDEPITDEERDGLAQLTHFVAFLALEAKSTRFATSVVGGHTLAYRALESHFGHLAGWTTVPRDERGLEYRGLVVFLMNHYPPHLPNG